MFFLSLFASELPLNVATSTLRGELVLGGGAAEKSAVWLTAQRNGGDQVLRAKGVLHCTADTSKGGSCQRTGNTGRREHSPAARKAREGV